MNELINYEPVCRTAPATPGLLKTSGCQWGSTKVAISILRHLDPLSGFLVKINNPLDDMRIRLLQISKMLQIRSKLPKSGAYWGHCSL